MTICRLVCALATATLVSGCATASPPTPSTAGQALATGTSATYRRAAAQRRPEHPTLVWTPANVALVSQQLAPGVFAVYPDDAARKNAAGMPVATSGGFVVGTDGVLLVDTMINRDLAGQLLGLVREHTNKPVLYAVNTSYHGDHSYGNQFLPESTQVIQHERTQAFIRESFAKDVAFMTQFFGAESGLQELEAQAADILLRDGETRDIDLGNKVVRVAHLGFAQTAGDLFVSVPADKVLFAGNPIISQGPSLPWLLDGHHAEARATLKRLRALFPGDMTIVPGHGVPTTTAVIDRYLQYLRALEDEVAAAIAAGLDARQASQRVGKRMQATYGGYKIYDWVHTEVNVGKVYAALTQRVSATSRQPTPDLVVINARITTLDDAQPQATALAVADGKIVAVGDDQSIGALSRAQTKVLDARGRRLIPGLNDSHSHYIRGGLFFNTELRWDGVPTLAEGLRRIRDQAARTPPGQWVRVVGGWTPWQFAEQRLPTRAELDAASPERPVYVQYFYSAAIVNTEGLTALGFTEKSTVPAGTRLERGPNGTLTGLLIADPHPALMYDSIARLPQLSAADQRNSTLQMFRTLARYGLTSTVDAGGGGQAFPDRYEVTRALARPTGLPIRSAFNLFPQRPGKELEDFKAWTREHRPGQGFAVLEDELTLHGAGEYLVWAAADFENFRSPRPEITAAARASLRAVVEEMVRRRWPFSLHATYDESISAILDVIEDVNKLVPLAGLRFSIDHAETISERNIRRVKALGGGIAVQSRMVMLGDDFIERYGAAAARQTPPVRRILELGVPLGLGTDATRGSTFNPFVTLHWLVTGRTASGRVIYGPENRLSRIEALRAHTVGSAWFSAEEDRKGRLRAGQYADFAILDADYLTVPDAEIPRIESLLTVVAGRIVHGAGEYTALAPPALAPTPAWSPTAHFDPYWKPAR